MLHAGYWLLYWFLFTFIFFVTQTTSSAAFDHWDDWLFITGLASLSGSITFYLSYFWLAPTYAFTEKTGRFVTIGFGISIAVATLVTLLVSLLITLTISVSFHTTPFFIFSASEAFTLTALFTVLCAINAAVGTILRGFVNWYDEIHLREILKNQNLRTELALLKAQINPHFLFNTLNNIDILIEKDSHAASGYLNKLSDILRFVLYESQADKVSLSREIEYIQKYIDLQKIRTSNPSYVSLKVEGDPAGLLIAPMVFIPYIENAFKYASNKKTSDGIRIYIGVELDQIRFQCINVVDATRLIPKTESSMGNELLEKRLKILYRDSYQLTIRNSNATYQVDLLLPIKSHELSHH